jgi:hypothetical protein
MSFLLCWRFRENSTKLGAFLLSAVEMVGEDSAALALIVGLDTDVLSLCGTIGGTQVE